jgi:hypothetical protein
MPFANAIFQCRFPTPFSNAVFQWHFPMQLSSAIFQRCFPTQFFTRLSASNLPHLGPWLTG